MSYVGPFDLCRMIPGNFHNLPFAYRGTETCSRGLLIKLGLWTAAALK